MVGYPAYFHSKPTNAGLNALFTVMANATISRVSLTKDGQVTLSLSNGKAKWFPLSYVKQLLVGNFLEEARPTILVGAKVTYVEHPYAIGDKCVDDKGVVSLTAVHKQAGVKLIKFEIDLSNVGSTLNEYDKQRMLSNAIASAMVATSGLFAAKPAKIAAEPAPEPESAPEPETEPAPIGEDTI